MDAEKFWRDTSPEWHIKIQAWERYQSKAKERDRAYQQSQRQRPDDDQGGTSTASADLSWEAWFDPSDPSPKFSFAGVKISYDKSKLDSDLQDLARWTSTPGWALHAIKRGIAVHHSGMNRKYRTLVEAYAHAPQPGRARPDFCLYCRLFRIGFLQVVIATYVSYIPRCFPCLIL